MKSIRAARLRLLLPIALVLSGGCVDEGVTYPDRDAGRDRHPNSLDKPTLSARPSNAEQA